MANPLRNVTLKKLAAAIAARHSNLEAFAAKHAVLWPMRTNVYGCIGLQGNALTSDPIGIILNIGVSFRSEELLVRKALNLRPYTAWTPTKSVVLASGNDLPDIALGSETFDIYVHKFSQLFLERIKKDVEKFSDEDEILKELYETYHQGGGKAQRLIAFLLLRGRSQEALSVANACSKLPDCKGRENSALDFLTVASNLILNE